MSEDLEKMIKQKEKELKELKEKREKKQRTTIYVDKNEWEALKIEAFEKKISITEILETLIKNHNKNYKASKNKQK